MHECNGRVEGRRVEGRSGAFGALKYSCWYFFSIEDISRRDAEKKIFLKSYPFHLLTKHTTVCNDPFSRLFIDQIEKGGEMKAEFTAIIEAAPEGGYWAICPEVPGANGQGEAIEETKNNLREAVELILEDRKSDIFRGLPEDDI